MLHQRKNPSAELSTDTRELIARLVGPLDKRGISRQVFRDCLAEAEAPVSKASLDRWVHNYAQSGRVFMPEKATGAAALLDAEQRDVAAGWVLSENDEHRPVSVESFRRFCNESLGVGMSPSSARNYLTDLGFASKVAQTNAIGFSIDVDALVEMMCEWVEERRSDGDLDKLVASVDFTYTGHRTDRVSSYARVGGAQPKSNMPIAQYTNCIVTCVRMESRRWGWTGTGGFTTEARRHGELQDFSHDPGPKPVHVEIENEPHPARAQAKIGEELRFVNRQQMLHGLDLHHDDVLDDEVHPVAAIELDALVFYGQVDLPLEWDPTQAQLVAKTLLIGRLEEAGTQCLMYFDRSTDNLVRKLLFQQHLRASVSPWFNH